MTRGQTSSGEANFTCSQRWPKLQQLNEAASMELRLNSVSINVSQKFRTRGRRRCSGTTGGEIWTAWGQSALSSHVLAER